MTHKQKILIMAARVPWTGKPGLWPAACKAQEWDDKDRELRLRVFSMAVGMPEFETDTPQKIRALLDRIGVVPSRIVVSSSDLDNKQDVDDVIRILRTLADDLRGPLDSRQKGAARRLRHKVIERADCLAGWPAHDPMGVAGAEAFVAKIIADKFNHGQPGLDLLDLTADPVISQEANGKLKEGPSQLDQLVITLNRCLNDFKDQAVPQPVDEDLVPF